MNILEKEIEDLVFEALRVNPNLLIERGLKHEEHATYLRQPDLGNYGRPDIVGYTIHPKKHGYRDISITIYELKKDQINIDTLLQAYRYVEGIRHYLREEPIFDYILNIDVILIGKTVETQSDFIFLSQQMHTVKIYSFGISLNDGLRFTREKGYIKTTPGFKVRKFNKEGLRTLLMQSEVHLAEQRFEREKTNHENPF